MAWTTPFIIYRLSSTGALEEVYHAADLKMAKYWLHYIAQPGDVLCKTPLHPKHSKAKESPEYWSHKEQSGTPATNENAWRNHATKFEFAGEFPNDQMKQTSDTA